MIKRLYWAVGLLGGIIVVGTFGYMALERWSLLDALFMTVITVGTVGFAEVHPLSPVGRVFTIILILAGVGALGFAFGQFVEFLVEGHLGSILEERRMEKRIEALERHTVVAGLGRVGSVVARTLTDEGAPFVVIDQAAESAELARGAGWAFVQGDATEEEVLRHAGIERAQAIVTALSGDAENLFVTVSARALNPDIFIVARSSHETTEAKLLNAGANRTITPNVIGGRRMASMVLNPSVSDYIEIVSSGAGVEFRLQEIVLGPGSCYRDRSIAESRIRDATGAQVVAIVKTDGRVDANPDPASVLQVGERLVVLGTAEQVARLAQEACPVGDARV